MMVVRVVQMPANRNVSRSSSSVLPIRPKTVPPEYPTVLIPARECESGLFPNRPDSFFCGQQSRGGMLPPPAAQNAVMQPQRLIRGDTAEGLLAARRSGNAGAAGDRVPLDVPCSGGRSDHRRSATGDDLMPPDWPIIGVSAGASP